MHRYVSCGVNYGDARPWFYVYIPVTGYGGIYNNYN